jgi:hypothetical protein
MSHWIWIPHAADPAELQASVNDFLARLQRHGGALVSVNYSAMGHGAMGAEPFFSLCLAYQSDLPPERLLAEPEPEALGKPSHAG